MENSGLERIAIEPGWEGASDLQKQCDQLQRIGWICGLAPWRVTGTFTFGWEASLESARRVFEKWMRRKVPRASYFYSIEANPGRDGYHVHSLWADMGEVFRRGKVLCCPEEWSDWFQRYGRARIEIARSDRDCAEYAAKYLTKPNAWWNVSLQWHRRRSLVPGDLIFGSERQPA